MILICPSCASRYFVDDAKLGPEGRQVRCASCGVKWLAKVGEPLELDAPAQPASPPKAEAAPPPAAAATVAATVAAPEVAPAAEASESDADAAHDDSEEKNVARDFRERVQAEKRDREAKATGVIWAGMAVFLALLVLAAVFLRTSVVELWPRTAGAYAAVGLPVNRVGLEIEHLKAEPTLQDGHAALLITGSLRNVTGKTVTSPNIEIKLLNPAGKVVAGKLAAPAEPDIPAGQTRSFAITILDPPSTAKDLIVGFASKAAGKAEKLKAPSAAHAEEEPDLRPATEPDALPTEAPGAPAAVEELPAH